MGAGRGFFFFYKNIVLLLIFFNNRTDNNNNDDSSSSTLCSSTKSNLESTPCSSTANNNDDVNGSKYVVKYSICFVYLLLVLGAASFFACLTVIYFNSFGSVPCTFFIVAFFFNLQL